MRESGTGEGGCSNSLFWEKVREGGRTGFWKGFVRTEVRTRG